ncbi:MAG: glucuronate isomerase [Anaerolineaceae bacterium]|nr:glucuronate isomerase [Anaerolineaceae bacterium]
MEKISLSADRYLVADPAQKAMAMELYRSVCALPLVCPHGHVDPSLFADPAASFGSPADLFIIPDHYVTRMLYSQGIPLETLGVPGVDGQAAPGQGSLDHREVWRLFCENFHLFRGTPSGIWLADELATVFGIHEKPCAANAGRLYEQIAGKLCLPEFRPRALFERFNIEVLCTTDAATDTLEHHAAIRSSGWKGQVLPTFRPDALVNLGHPDWRAQVDHLSQVSGIDVVDFPTYLRALEQRREFFKHMGAKATDHAALTPATLVLSPPEAGRIFQHALRGDCLPGDAARFTAHMLVEMARMSIEDGLVMQLHPGALRDHNRQIFQRFGPDKGADIPLQTEYTRNLLPLLERFGSHPGLTLVLFTLDESTYSRELATLAGHYPALRLGPPWWFYDSLNGMARYFDQVMETAGIYNTAGFNDDTRAFCSIPARHDVWRRAAANWVAGLLVRRLVDEEDAFDIMHELAIGLAKRTYKL